MKKRTFAMVLAMLLVLGLVLSGCTPKQETTAPAQEVPKATVEKVLKFSLDAEPPELDPQKGTDLTSILVAGHVLEGLTKVYDGKVLPGVAEKWDISSDGLSYTFHLRDTKWSDGVQITAKDFEYSIIRLLDPNTAGGYTEIMGFLIKNGEKFYNGEVTREQVGVKVINDKTIELTLEAPTAYFLRALGFMPYWPSRQDVVEKYADAFSSDADKMVYNGPYVVKEWKHEEGIVLAKNSTYWDADKVKADIINLSIVSDEKTAINLYESGELLSVGIPADMVDQYKSSGEAKFMPNGGVYFLQFNFKNKEIGKILSNVNFRKAISYCIDRAAFAEHVAKRGAMPATRFVPPIIMGIDKKYTDEHPYEPIPTGADLEKAKEYFEKALKELNMTAEKFPTIKLLTRDDATRRTHMEAVIDMVSKGIGINMEIVQVPKKQMFQMLDDADYDIAYSNWFPDYDDPMTYLDIFITGCGVNRGYYSSAKYDEAIKIAKTTPDLKLRSDKLFEAEQILIEDMPVISLFWGCNAYVESDKLVNYVRSLVGADPDLSYVDIKE